MQSRLSTRSLIVARREYLALVRSKAFVIGLVLAPALMALGVYLTPSSPDSLETGPRAVAIADQTGELGERLLGAAREAGLEPVLTSTSAAGASEELTHLEAEVQSGQLAALLLVSDRALDDSGPDQVAIVAHNLTSDAARLLAKVARETIGLWRLEAAGVDAARARSLLQGVQIELRSPQQEAEESLGALLTSMVSPLFALLMVFMAVMSSAPYTLHSVIEEKQQRIAEVLLGCMSPFELMAGKLLGAVLAGLTVVGAYAIMALATASHYGLDAVITPGLIALSVADSLIAIALFGSIFLAMGAASSELKDAQGYMTPMMVVMMLPLMMTSQIFRDPDGPLSVALSLFPLTAPMILPLRLFLGAMPGWQLAIAITGTLAFTWASIWAAGRVFRIGILAQGQAPRLGEILRWIRHG